MPRLTTALGPQALRHLRDVLGHYEVRDLPSGDTLFVCARCRRKFAYPTQGRFLVPAAHLVAHLLTHGVRFERAVQSDRVKRWAKTEQSAGDASRQRALWPDADRAEPGAGPVRRR